MGQRPKLWYNRKHFEGSEYILLTKSLHSLKCDIQNLNSSSIGGLCFVADSGFLIALTRMNYIPFRLLLLRFRYEHLEVKGSDQSTGKRSLENQGSHCKLRIGNLVLTYPSLSTCQVPVPPDLIIIVI